VDLGLYTEKEEGVFIVEGTKERDA